MAGYIGLLVSNFFGFSVVPDQLQLFLFPGFAIALSVTEEEITKKERLQLRVGQKTALAVLLLFTFYLLFLISHYWYADIEYNYGKSNNQVGKPNVGVSYLQKAISLIPGQPKYHDELASSFSTLAQAAAEQKNATAAAQLSSLAVSEEEKAVDLSPQNVLIKITEFGTYIRLSSVNEGYLQNARQVLIEAINLAPTYAKLYYNLGLVYARTGDNQKAMQTLQKTIELKANYAEARLAYAFMLINTKRPAEAKDQLEYILTKIDPANAMAKQTLESLK